MAPLIGIVLGSYSDVKLMRAGLDRLTAMEVPFEMAIASAHRTPERLTQWLAGVEERGARVIIAGAGAAAHLSGVVASKTLLPVVGVPFDSSALRGHDALYSIVQMPPGIPVATVGIDAAENAALLALHILAVSDAAIRAKLRDYRAGWEAKIEEQNAKLYEEYPQARPPATEPAAGSAQTPLPGPAASPAEGQGASPRRPRAASSSGGSICRVDRDAPDVSVIEEAADVLLGGGVVALPTDTVYGLAADATNQHAVQELYQIKDRDPKKAVPVLVDSIKLFRALVHDLPAEVEALIEKLWPGALTVVARKKRGVLQSVSLGETIGVRMPNSMVALAVISMLARPMATSSANVSGRSPATSAQEVMRTLGNKVDLILDAGPTPGGATSTVLSVVERPFTILRQGQIERAALHEILGDLLA